MTTPTYDDGKSRPLGPEALPEPDPRLAGFNRSPATEPVPVRHPDTGQYTAAS